MLLAQGGVVADPRRELDLGDALQLFERVVPALRVLVLFGSHEQFACCVELRLGRRSAAAATPADQQRRRAGRRRRAKRPRVSSRSCPRSPLPERRADEDPLRATAQSGFGRRRAGAPARRVRHSAELSGASPISPGVRRFAIAFAPCPVRPFLSSRCQCDLHDILRTMVAATRTPCARAMCARARRVGFVPTMGALHAGPSRASRARPGRRASVVVASIFVNPTQFGPNEDLVTVSARPRWRPSEARDRWGRRGVRSGAGRALPDRGRDAGPGRSAGRAALRGHAAGALRRRRDRRREALRHRRAERRRLREEGLPAASRHPSDGSRSRSCLSRSSPSAPSASRTGSR